MRSCRCCSSHTRRQPNVSHKNVTVSGNVQLGDIDCHLLQTIGICYLLPTYAAQIRTTADASMIPSGSLKSLVILLSVSVIGWFAKGESLDGIYSIVPVSV